MLLYICQAAILD